MTMTPKQKPFERIAKTLLSVCKVLGISASLSLTLQGQDQPLDYRDGDGLYLVADTDSSEDREIFQLRQNKPL